MDEGYIKFNCHWLKSEPVKFAEYKKLNNWRNKLFKLGLIGIYPNQISFGNISVRADHSSFYITGSSTGGLKVLSKHHYSLVTNFDFKKNSLTCKGPIKASSESLSHAAVYLAAPSANAVIHIHHLKTWRKLFNQIPTTSPTATYGTPEMAKEIIRLFKETELPKVQILIMGGHEQGIIAFGKDLAEAGNILLSNLSN